MEEVRKCLDLPLGLLDRKLIEPTKDKANSRPLSPSDITDIAFVVGMSSEESIEIHKKDFAESHGISDNVSKMSIKEILDMYNKIHF